MRHTIIGLAILSAMLLVLSGCAQLPRRSVVSPPEPVSILDARPAVANGSIFQAQRGVQPLFEDRRPRMPGDILTIVLEEEVSATKNAESNANRQGSASLDLAELPPFITERISELEDLGFDVSGANDFSGGGDSRASNTFDGTITVTVVEVLPNGNLRVRGEKHIAINQGAEFIRFSGVVNPRTITGENTVASTAVADARIEYVGDGYINEAQHMGWLQRFFLNVSPF
ncbi:MAG: flagellar basal body L-ring protein FlgH [Gammaproteobacteria bacterium]|nr:flagellar basal body L-ring protein FlgH [Gammaproteobacteria bacterium]